MSQPYRLRSGGCIDREHATAFQFDGTNFEGHAGDTLASALLANGVHLVARSFKYHRPRGILSAGSEEPNALVTVHRGAGRVDPNTRATTVELHDGVSASSQNRWPSLKHDFSSINDRLSAMLPAGFYYKTFMWPRQAWHQFYEPRIRERAGLGAAPVEPDPDSYSQRYAHCDVLVIGAGPAGLAAAQEAARQSLRVILCDEQPTLGESLLYADDSQIDDLAPSIWRAALLQDLGARPNVRLLPRTTAFGYFAHNFVGLVEKLTDHLPAGDLRAQGARERLWQVRARFVILATGAVERPLVFRNNDRPGIMLAGAVQRYVRQYAVLPGKRIVACVSDPSGYEAVRSCRDAGADIIVVDLAGTATDASGSADSSRGNQTLVGYVPVDTRGRRRVSSVAVQAKRADGALTGNSRWFDCDLVMMAGGWTPNVNLHSQSRGTVAWDDHAQGFLPNRAAQAAVSAGASRGVAGLQQCVIDGRAIARDIGLRCGVTFAAGASLLPASLAKRPTVAVLPAARIGDGNKAFVDFQNDVTARDIRLAVREGFESVEHFKRYTTLGMATDQGRTSNINGLAIAAQSLQLDMSKVGLTTFRVPYTPVTFGALAGPYRSAQFDPVRVTPMHDRAVALGAVFEDVGPWKRARYFARAGEEASAAIERECRVVRSTVGVFDGSTLGKIEVVGPDAAELMNRIYTNSWSKLEPRRCRYGLMLRDDGYIFDDGVVGRIDAERFHVTTTTSGAANVLHHMEDFLQTEYSDLRVWLTPITEQWAVIAVQGPRAREVIEPLVDDIDVSRDAFPHMALRIGHICGVPVRLFRVSFTGELGFEVNIPASQGAMVWDAIYARATTLGGVPYGTDAMHVLRAEKGYIIIGQETDGTVTASDAGLDWAVGKTKGDFVGKRSLNRAALLEAPRQQLVGLWSCDERTVLIEGAQLLPEFTIDALPKSQGHVTSAYFSVAAGRPIALALLANGRARHGELVHATSNRGVVPVRVAPPIFVDPENHRLAL